MIETWMRRLAGGAQDEERIPVTAKSGLRACTKSALKIQGGFLPVCLFFLVMRQVDKHIFRRRFFDEPPANDALQRFAVPAFPDVGYSAGDRL